MEVNTLSEFRGILCLRRKQEQMGELRNMNEPWGKFCIQNLHRVKTRKEATEAALKNKRYVRMLEMEWADDRKIDQVDNQLEESIIEELQPPSHLKDLTVKCYAGMHFPSWMNNSSISGLESIRLHRCINLIPLPSVEHLSFLRTLEITSCSQMDELPCLPTALRNLILQDVSFSALPNNLHDLALQQLVICQIPELWELPLLPITLKELTVDGVGVKAFPEFYLYHGLSAMTSRGGDSEGSSSRKPSLSILKFHGCNHLTTLDEGLLRHKCRASWIVRSLYIGHRVKGSELPFSPLRRS
uniref:Putative disease resistance protein RGA1 n=1 Tax=Anthurium amnicola TaxID=1678845 RepID=A0A1D1ZFX9_9ARAE